MEAEPPFEPDDQLWKELATSKALDLELVEEYRSAVKTRPWVPLGRILMQLGLLRTREVFRLLERQADEPDMRLGDLAVHEGLCTVEHVRQALRIQREQYPGPIELLLRDSRVDSEGLLEALVGYVHHLEGRLYALVQEQRRAEAGFQGERGAARASASRASTRRGSASNEAY